MIGNLNIANSNRKDTNIKFTKDQEIAVHELIEFLAQPWDDKKYINALCGAGGTGKTFVIKYIINNCKWSGGVISCAAPTHKACRVLSNSIGGKEVNTIQSLFGFRLDVNIENFDPENPAFNPVGKDKLDSLKVLIIDEASMLNAKLVKYISNKCKKLQIKVIMLGDPSQLPPVNEKTSQAFLIASNTYYLKEVVRQGDNNPISKLLKLLREDIDNKNGWRFLDYISKNRQDYNEETKGFYVCGQTEFSDLIDTCFNDEEYTKNIDLYRIIAYTNNRVAQWNNHVRHMIIKDADKSLITRNDLIMSYTTVVNVFNDIIIHNSEEYIVKDIVDTVDNDYGFKGFLIKFQAIHGGSVTRPLFVIDHYDNYTFQMYYKKLTSLIDDAKKASSSERGSVTQPLFVIDHYDNYTFQMYYKKLTSLIDDAKKASSSERGSKWKQYFDFKRKYLLASNITNSNGKILFSRDLDYGFAITSHRAQGSTYRNVFVDINNMIYDKYGHPYTNRDEMLRRLYVACSRASNQLVLSYGK